MTTTVAAEILKLFKEAYIVGGAVRDAVLKKQVKDLDLVVKGGPDFSVRVRKLARKLNASVFMLDEERQVARLTQRATGLQLDISPFQGKDLQEDLSLRDYTVNAMALPLTPCYRPLRDKKTGLFQLPAVKRTDIIDPSAGLKDLKAKIIRLVDPKALTEDPLRLLRAFRFSAALSFEIEPKTLKLIRLHSALITKSAPERNHDELRMILASPAEADRTKEL